MYEQINELIKPELLILIPVLYLTGVCLKKTRFVKDTLIPAFLGVAGIALSIVYLLSKDAPQNIEGVFALIFSGMTQGVLCAGASVYFNQLVKQSKKDKKQNK